MQQDFDEAVRLRAYYLWHKEGCPEGRDREFWERARLLQEEDAKPLITTALQTRSAAERAVDEAAAQSFPASDPPATASTSGPGAGDPARNS